MARGGRRSLGANEVHAPQWKEYENRFTLPSHTRREGSQCSHDPRHARTPSFGRRSSAMVSPGPSRRCSPIRGRGGDKFPGRHKRAGGGTSEPHGWSSAPCHLKQWYPNRVEMRINVHSRTFKEGVETPSPHQVHVVDSANLGYPLSSMTDRDTKPESYRRFDPATMGDGNGNPKRESERPHKDSLFAIIDRVDRNHPVSRFQTPRTHRTDRRRNLGVPRPRLRYGLYPAQGWPCNQAPHLQPH